MEDDNLKKVQNTEYGEYDFMECIISVTNDYSSKEQYDKNYHGRE